MDEGERYTMRIHRTTEQNTYTAEAETDTGLSKFNGFHEHLGCTRCASFYTKVGRKDPVVQVPATTALVDVSGKHTCADCSCDMYNMTRQGDSVFFETGPGTRHRA